MPSTLRTQVMQDNAGYWEDADMQRTSVLCVALLESLYLYEGHTCALWSQSRPWGYRKWGTPHTGLPCRVLFVFFFGLFWLNTFHTWFLLLYPQASSVTHMDSAPLTLPLCVPLPDESAQWVVGLFLNVIPASGWLAIMKLQHGSDCEQKKHIH